MRTWAPFRGKALKSNKVLAMRFWLMLAAILGPKFFRNFVLAFAAFFVLMMYSFVR